MMNSISQRKDQNYGKIHSQTAPGTTAVFTPAQVSKLLKCRLLVTFLFLICAVIAFYQIPIILFYVNINPKLVVDDITDHVDFKSCSVNVSAS